MKRWFSLTLTLVMLLSMLIACGTETPTEVPAGDTGTGSTSTETTTDNTTDNNTDNNAASQTVKIVSSLPRTGSSKGQTDTIVNAIQMRFEEANYQACDGAVTIVYEDMDDATAAKGSWDEAKEAENAQEAASDDEVLVYIGPFNSGAGKISIPILNNAGLAMISPSNTAIGLTKPFDPGEPDIYYPSGKRNYTRVIPSDDFQGAAGANWAAELGLQNVYVLDDNELYGKGLADVFSRQAEENGLTIVGRDSIDAKASDYQSLMNKISATEPDLIYFGGITQNNAGQLVKDMRAVGMTNDQVKFMGPDGIFEQAFIEAAGADNAEGAYITFGGVPPAKLTGKGAEWYANYKEKFGSEPEAYAAYGYEAASVAVDAVNRSCDTLTREAVVDALFATQNFDGVLGTWSFDANGDTSLTELSGQQVVNGEFQYVQNIK